MTDDAATPSAEDRRKHLEFIQAVVTRMSASSATAKGWLLPVVTAAYGYAVTKSSVGVGLLGITATLVFGLMDANYLRQEKAFRGLYDAVASGTKPVPLFSLDPSHANDPIPDGTRLQERLRKIIGRWVPGRSVWLSWSIAPFYAAFVVAGVVVVPAA